MYLAYVHATYRPIYARAHPLDVHTLSRARSGLATWQLQVERLRRALGGRFSILARSSRGLHRAFSTASRPRCLLCSSRGSRLDVEVLRRPRWRWRPAHSSAASTHDRASSRVPTGLGQTHRRCLRPDGRRCTRCRASGDDRRALAPRAEPAPPEGEPGPPLGEPAPTRRGSSSAPGSWLRFWLPFCRYGSSVCMRVPCRSCSRRA